MMVNRVNHFGRRHMVGEHNATVDSRGDVPGCSRSVWQDDWRDGLAGASESRAWFVRHEANNAWGIIEVEG